MARLARAIVPGLPLHVTQRGNRRQQTFFTTDDYRLYLAILAGLCARHDVQVWAYCVMPNHVHLVVVPASEKGLRLAIGETHRRYTREVNERMGWSGFLWQGRFASVAMDEAHTLAAARYVELNPVRAGLVTLPGDYAWSSAPAHLAGLDDGLVKTAPLLERVGDWAAFLGQGLASDVCEQVRRHTRSGRPLGDDAFLEQVERALGRVVRPRKPGPPPGSASIQQLRVAMNDLIAVRRAQ